MSNILVSPAFHGDAPAAADGTALPDRKELALVAVERTRMAMVVTDARRKNNPIVLANKAFLDLTGYTAEEVIGRNCRFMQGPETLASAIDTIRRGLAESEHHVTTELINYRKDGSTFWNRLCISPVWDENESLLYYFASQQDVSEKYRVTELEDERRHLLLEVDHRAMNALALVNSFVRLSKSDTASGYAAAVTRRVDVLARAHRNLARSGWSGSNLRDLIEAEIPPGLAHRIDISGPEFKISALRVQPISLIFHELMANAVIHGALRTSIGSISISWIINTQNAIEIEWHETVTDEALISDVAKPGIGLQLVTSLVEQQLGGRTWSSQSSDKFNRCFEIAIE